MGTSTEHAGMDVFIQKGFPSLPTVPCKHLTQLSALNSESAPCTGCLANSPGLEPPAILKKHIGLFQASAS